MSEACCALLVIERDGEERFLVAGYRDRRGAIAVSEVPPARGSKQNLEPEEVEQVSGDDVVALVAGAETERSPSFVALRRDGTLYRWERTHVGPRGAPRWRATALPVPPDACTTLAAYSDGTLLLGARSGALYVSRERAAPSVLSALAAFVTSGDTDYVGTPRLPGRGAGAAVTALLVTRRGTVVSGNARGELHVWETWRGGGARERWNTARLVGAASASAVTALAEIGNDALVAAHADGALHVWRSERDTYVRDADVPRAHTRAVTALAVYRDTASAADASRDRFEPLAATPCVLLAGGDDGAVSSYALARSAAWGDRALEPRLRRALGAPVSALAVLAHHRLVLEALRDGGISIARLPVDGYVQMPYPPATTQVDARERRATFPRLEPARGALGALAWTGDAARAPTRLPPTAALMAEVQR